MKLITYSLTNSFIFSLSSSSLLHHKVIFISFQMQTPYGDAIDLIKQYLIYEEEYRHSQMLSKIRNTVNSQREEDEKNNYPLPYELNREFRDVKISELFEFAGNGKQENSDLPDGKYPLISTSSHNNGIIKYVNEYDFDGTYVTVTFNGSVGSCFVQRGKFILGHGQVIALKLKPEYSYLEKCLNSLAFAMTMEFKMKYSYCNKLNRERLMNETISSIPFCQDANDKTKMIVDVSGLRYIYIYSCDDKVNGEKEMYEVDRVNVGVNDEMNGNLMNSRSKMKMNGDLNDSPTDNPNISHYTFESPMNVMMKEVRIDELFELCKNKGVILNGVNPGPYQLVSAIASNNGIYGTVDHYQFDGTYVTIAGTGEGAGSCFVQHGKFTVTNNVKVLKLCKEYEHLEGCLGSLAFIMTQKFIKIYGWTHVVNDKRLMNETIELPVVVKGLSEKGMNNVRDGVVTIDELVGNEKYEYEINGNLLNNHVYENMM